MRVLYIDTSSSFLYTGIVEDDKLLIEIGEKLDTNLSRDALPRIASMFNEVGLVPSDINKIIVVDGPGSFTGIRIGITIAKVFAFCLNIKITSISSLEAMAISSFTDCYKVPITDARRGYVYAGIFDKDMKCVLDMQHIKLSLLEMKLKSLEKYKIITNDEISIIGDKITYKPNILEIVKKYRTRNNINPHSVNPNYLKLTEAEESLISNDRKVS